MIELQIVVHQSLKIHLQNTSSQHPQNSNQYQGRVKVHQ